MEQYPRIEIEQEEFNVYVVRYTSWIQRETIGAFPYSHDGEYDSLALAIEKAKQLKAKLSGIAA